MNVFVDITFKKDNNSLPVTKRFYAYSLKQVQEELPSIYKDYFHVKCELYRCSNYQLIKTLYFSYGTKIN